MVEKYGNYEVDFTELFVRLKLSEGHYEYVIFADMYSSRQDASRACRAFQIGFTGAQEHTCRKLQNLIWT